MRPTVFNQAVSVCAAWASAKSCETSGAKIDWRRTGADLPRATVVQHEAEACLVRKLRNPAIPAQPPSTIQAAQAGVWPKSKTFREALASAGGVGFQWILEPYVGCRSGIPSTLGSLLRSCMLLVWRVRRQPGQLMSRSMWQPWNPRLRMDPPGRLRVLSRGPCANAALRDGWLDCLLTHGIWPRCSFQCRCFSGFLLLEGLQRTPATHSKNSRMRTNYLACFARSMPAPASPRVRVSCCEDELWRFNCHLIQLSLPAKSHLVHLQSPIAA